MTKTAFAATAIAILLSGTAMIAPTHAENNTGTQGNLMSYAPETKFDDGRFGLFNFDAEPMEYGEEHELNDMWLGLSAYSKDGEYVGSIEDAILDDEGNVIELVVAPPNGDVSVQLQVDYADLGQDRVTLDLSRNDFASILNDGELVVSMR